MHVLIVGCGYVGFPLAAELARQGHEVFGLRRSASADADLKAAGIKALHADITKPETLASLPNEFDWVVNCAATSGGDVEDYRRLYLQGTRNLIEWLRPGALPLSESERPLTPSLSSGGGENSRRPGEGEICEPVVEPARLKTFVWTSSTGVYGQTDGSIVTEASPTEPEGETANMLVETEKLLMTAASPGGHCSVSAPIQGSDEALPSTRPFPAIILRVAGIYGPDRGHWFKQFLRGQARIEGDGSRILNMIHRDDVVGAIIAALKNGKAGETYNVVDDEPVSQRNFFAWLAQKLGRPMPPSVPRDAEANRKRGVTNKKVSNRKLKMELGYQFKYPDFRQGYTAELIRSE
jgi:nucleoside-diphosphate-sugar epimerase